MAKVFSEVHIENLLEKELLKLNQDPQLILELFSELPKETINKNILSDHPLRRLCCYIKYEEFLSTLKAMINNGLYLNYKISSSYGNRTSSICPKYFHKVRNNNGNYNYNKYLLTYVIEEYIRNNKNYLYEAAKLLVKNNALPGDYILFDLIEKFNDQSKNIMELLCSNNYYFINNNLIIPPITLVNLKEDNAYIYIKLLLENGSDPNAKYINEESIFNYFLRNISEYYKFSIPVIKLLLKYNVEINFETSGGMNALSYFIMHYKKYDPDGELVQQFIDYGIDVNHKSKSGATALVYLFHTKFNDTTITLANILLDNNADVNIKFGKKQNTLLMCASQFVYYTDKQKSLIKRLLDMGADPYEKNLFNDNAISVAICPEIEELLISYK